MTKRAILYARVSGDDRKYATSGIESQLADCRKYADERGYQVIAEMYETPDKVTSGADWLPELDRVLKLAQGSGFDVLVVREVDRLARNRFKQMSIEIQLESCGARVEYVIGQFEESAEGRLLKGLMSEFAEYEREKIKERTRRGVLRSVEAGNVTTGGFYGPYGYDLVTLNGKRALAINEQEADVIRLVFDLYVNQGRSINAIGCYLSDRQIPKPCKGTARTQSKINRSDKWNNSSVLSILMNETYTGRWHYGKTKTVKSTQGKSMLIPRPREEWIEIEVPPIIDEATYQAAMRQRDVNKKLKGKQHHHFYLLGGMLRCGHCGHSAIGMTHNRRKKSYQYYKCAACHIPGRYNVTCDNNPAYVVGRVNLAVWGYVKCMYTSPKVLQEALDNYQVRQTDEQSPIMKMIESTAARLAETEQEKGRLLKAYTSGILSLEDIATEKVEVDKRAADLTKALADLRSELSPTIISQDDVDGILRDAAKMREGILLADDNPFEQRRILEQLLTQCRLVNVDGKQFVDVDCILGEARLSTEFNTMCYHRYNIALSVCCPA